MPLAPANSQIKLAAQGALLVNEKRQRHGNLADNTVAVAASGKAGLDVRPTEGILENRPNQWQKRCQ